MNLQKKCLNNCLYTNKSIRSGSRRHNRPSNRAHFIRTGLLVLAALISVSCGKDTRKRPVIIWTDISEFVAYSEVFNASQNSVGVVVNYKENPALSLPAAKDEPQPDIIIGPSLRTESVIKQFKALNYMFSSHEVNKNLFYPQLLDACKKNGYTYLIPVSFNLPTVMFAASNSSYISDNYMLSLDQIRTAGAAYNEKNENNLYTRMGFAPQWNTDFLCLAAMMNNAMFHEKKNTLLWDKNALDSTVSYLRSWTTNANDSFAAEQDFSFKYLFTPAYSQIMSKRCLFAYMSSRELFALTPEQLENVDFRWIHRGNAIPIVDPMITMGIYKHGKNRHGAEQFIKWFFTEKAQKAMLEHVQDMNLSTKTFGIAGGFSTLKGVNEHIFPIYYNPLLVNIPMADYIEALPVLPMHWTNLREKVIDPYLLDAIHTDPEYLSKIKTLEGRLTDWDKQYF